MIHNIKSFLLNFNIFFIKHILFKIKKLLIKEIISKDNIGKRLHKSTFYGNIHSNSKKGVLDDNKIAKYEMEVT